MGCIHFFVFMNIKSAIHNLFFSFLISQISLFWPQITIIIIEISLKKMNLQNMKGITQIHTGLAWKVLNFIFQYFWKHKNSSYTQTFKYMPWAQFSSWRQFFLDMLLTLSSIRQLTQNAKITYCWQYDPLKPETQINFDQQVLVSVKLKSLMGLNHCTI